VTGSPPQSYTYDQKSILDTIRAAVWINASNFYLSTPGRKNDVARHVVPTQVGDQQPGKYLTRHLNKVAAVGEEYSLAVQLILVLIKRWYKTVESSAKQIIQRQKIPWRTVLNNIPHVEKKIKGKTVRYIQQPLKPTKNPYLFAHERRELERIIKGHLEFQEATRKSWIEADPLEQHTNYDVTVKGLVKIFTSLKQKINNINISIGRRKTTFDKLFKRLPKNKKLTSPTQKVQACLSLSEESWNGVDLTIFNPNWYLNKIPDGWKESDDAKNAVVSIRTYMEETFEMTFPEIIEREPVNMQDLPTKSRAARDDSSEQKQENE
jgi:hypothetical protein